MGNAVLGERSVINNFCTEFLLESITRECRKNPSILFKKNLIVI